MKNIKTLVLASALLGLALTQAQAQFAIGDTKLLAAWDFDGVAGGTVATIAPRYSDTYGDNGPAPYSIDAGNMFFNGVGGSDNWNNISKLTTGADGSRPIIGRLGSPLGALSGGEGMINAAGTIDTTRNEFSILVHSATAVNTFENLALSFFARNTTGTGTTAISWAYSLDAGATKIATGLSNIISGTSFGTEYTQDFSSLAALDAIGDLYLIGTISETNPALALQFDNLAVYGTVLAAIPEPSTYAAIMGALVIGVAALRRRKSALLA